jgi:hypothetical protein
MHELFSRKAASAQRNLFRFIFASG